jgi:hypothetical protein
MARELVEHRFKPEELQALGAELGRANQTIYDLRGERTSVATSLGASIKAAEKFAAELTTKLNQKFELREIEVIFKYNTPKLGLKTVYRADNDEEVRVAPMSPEEQQREFNFSDDPRPER